MNADPPRITVVTPSFNQGRFIEKTIDSVLSQAYPNLEYIIIDGGSKDETVEIVKRYEKHLSYWVSEPDRGQSHAINKGMERSSGHLLTWLNSDDWYVPGALWRFADLFRANPDAGVVVGAGKIVDLKGRDLHYKTPNGNITLGSMFCWASGGNFMQPSSMFSRTAWNAAGPVDESIHIAMDLDLWLRMARQGIHFVTTPELLSIAQGHPKAKTTEFEELMLVDCAFVIWRHGGAPEARKALEKMARNAAALRRRCDWYLENYGALVDHPVLKFLRPVLKRLSRDETGYWRDAIPPWVKGRKES